MLPEGIPVYDFVFGPRVFDAEMAPLFMQEYVVKARSDKPRDAMLRPDLYFNALNAGPWKAMSQGFHVVGAEVPYLHPQELTNFESASPVLMAKRLQQFQWLVREQREFMCLLKGQSSALRLAA